MANTWTNVGQDLRQYATTDLNVYIVDVAVYGYFFTYACVASHADREYSA